MEKKTIYQVVKWSSCLGDLGLIWEDEVDSYWEQIEDAYKQALVFQQVYTYEETKEDIDRDEQTYFVVNKITMNPSKIK